MKQIFTAVLLFIANCAFSQTDNNGNPIFNSVTTKEEQIKDFQFISNYYTLKNNIESKNSSVYISDNPTRDQVEKAAINLPSDFFLVVKNHAVINMVLVLNKPLRSFLVVNPATGKKNQFSCSIEGDISEIRANEIIKEKYDPEAKIVGNKLFFNKKQLSIIPSEEIKKSVLDLIDNEKLNLADKSTMKMLSKEELKDMILKESKDGGKLDFFTEIKGHEYDGIQIRPGLIGTRLEIALYKWGRANFTLGVNTIEDALAIWAQLKGRPANAREITGITQGFNKEFEK